MRAFAGFGYVYLAGLVAVRAALGHASLKSRGRVMNVPPVILAATIAAVVGHNLQIKTGAQALGGDGSGNNTAVAVIKNTVTRHIGGLMPKLAYSSDVAQ